MRYRLFLLCLAAVLGVLPGLTTVSAVPAPRRPKTPTIYALIYVGLGKNDPDNAKRIDVALQSLPNQAGSALRVDAEVNALSIVQDKIKKQGWKELDAWAKSNTRAANLEGTSVFRVWFTDGSPEEKVVFANGIARTYVEGWQEIARSCGGLKGLERYKANYIKNIVMRPLNKEEERSFRRQEEAYKHLPHVIEWAALPEKP